MKFRAFGFALLGLLCAACGGLPFKEGDMVMNPGSDEHYVMAYFIMLDTKGKNMSFTPKVCVNNTCECPNHNCPQVLGAYADDKHKVKGGLVFWKTTDKSAKITSLTQEASIFDNMGGTEAKMRTLTLTFDGLETPLEISGNSKDYTFYSAVDVDNGKGVKVNKVDSCARVDGVYLGSYAFQFVDKGMPAPELAMQDLTAKNLHYIQASLLKYRAKDSLKCYAIANIRPKVIGKNLQVSH
jgi:hypothetical protein